MTMPQYAPKWKGYQEQRRATMKGCTSLLYMNDYVVFWKKIRRLPEGSTAMNRLLRIGTSCD